MTDKPKRKSTKKTVAVVEAKPEVVKEEKKKKVVPVSAVPPVVQEKKKRHVLSKDEIEAEFKAMKEKFESDIANIRTANKEAKEKKTKKVVSSLKTMLGLSKMYRKLMTDAFKVMKIRSATSRRNDSNAGFNKPYQLTPVLYEFTGWAVGSLHSRNEVTKFICQYVKDHKLQDKTCGSLINPDLPLQKLLGYDPKNIPLGEVTTFDIKEVKDEKTGKMKKVKTRVKTQGPLVLNFFRLQIFLKKHYIKVEAPVKA